MSDVQDIKDRLASVERIMRRKNTRPGRKIELGFMRQTLQRQLRALCLCPSDCNCHRQGAPFHRVAYCGCQAHV